MSLNLDYRFKNAEFQKFLTRMIICIEYAMANRVVVHYLNGELEKGYTTDFQPDKDVFHLVIAEAEREMTIPIKIDNLKAVFFVKEFKGVGGTGHVDKITFEDIKDQQLSGKKVRVEFNDGEVICGFTLGYSPQRRGFFFTPLDTESNNERIFAVLKAVKDIKFYD